MPGQRLRFHLREPRPLTPRELDVLNWASHGYSNRMIGEQLFVTENTVKTHVRNAQAKLRSKNRTHAVALAIRYGLSDVDTPDEREEP